MTNHGITNDDHAIDQWLASKSATLTRETYNTAAGEFMYYVGKPLADASHHKVCYRTRESW